MVNIVPLFETIGDSTFADIMRAAFRLPVYRRWLGSRAAGRSDARLFGQQQDGGFVTANWGALSASSSSSRPCQAFDSSCAVPGRGGSVGGGGGPTTRRSSRSRRQRERRDPITDKARSLPASTRIRSSPTQPESWSPRRSRRASCPARRRRCRWPTITPRWTSFLRSPLAAYRSLVYDTPEFVPFFRASTPIAEIAELNLGSGPRRAKTSQKIEDLRAIPWVFSWSQCRVSLPGWYGFGTAVDAWLADGAGTPRRAARAAFRDAQRAGRSSAACSPT